MTMNLKTAGGTTDNTDKEGMAVAGVYTRQVAAKEVLDPDGARRSRKSEILTRRSQNQRRRVTTKYTKHTKPAFHSRKGTLRLSVFLLAHSHPFGFVSDFELRISDFRLRRAAFFCDHELLFPR